MKTISRVFCIGSAVLLLMATSACNNNNRRSGTTDSLMFDQDSAYEPDTSIPHNFEDPRYPGVQGNQPTDTTRTAAPRRDSVTRPRPTP